MRAGGTQHPEERDGETGAVSLLLVGLDTGIQKKASPTRPEPLDLCVGSARSPLVWHFSALPGMSLSTKTTLPLPERQRRGGQGTGAPNCQKQLAGPYRWAGTPTVPALPTVPCLHPGAAPKHQSPSPGLGVPSGCL